MWNRQFVTEKHRTTRRRRWAIVAIVILVGLATHTAYHLADRYFGEPRRFAVVEPGVLYRSGQPYVAEIDHLIDSIGLKTIVIARDGVSHRVPDEIAHAKERGVNVVHIPIVSRQTIPDEQAAAFFKCIDDPSHYPILVHCSAGRHRTGYLCALYRIERQGWSVERAVEEMLSFEPDMSPNRSELKQLKAYVPGTLSGEIEKKTVHAGGDESR